MIKQLAKPKCVCYRKLPRGWRCGICGRVNGRRTDRQKCTLGMFGPHALTKDFDERDINIPSEKLAKL